MTNIVSIPNLSGQFFYSGECTAVLKALQFQYLIYQVSFLLKLKIYTSTNL